MKTSNSVAAIVCVTLTLTYIFARGGYHDGVNSNNSIPQNHPHTQGSPVSNQSSNTPPAHLRIVDLNVHIADTMQCVHLSVGSKPRICVHPLKEDKIVSYQIVHHGVYERKYMEKYISILKEYPASGLIDIGGNIGQYSLIAAGLGHNVIAVEPFKKNIHRFTKSIQINKFTNIKIVQNGLSNTRVVFPIQQYIENQGQTRLRGVEINDTSLYTIGETAIETIVMDDLVPLIDFDTAIVKMDIEGYEARALSQASALFEKVKIPYIMMEWAILLEWIQQKNKKEINYIHYVIDFLKNRKYVPYDINDNKKVNLLNKDIGAWPNFVIWKHVL